MQTLFTVSSTLQQDRSSPFSNPASRHWYREIVPSPLCVGGLLLVVSGMFHLIVWAIQGGPWEGPLAWRKPILFGFSAGVTAISLAWVLSLMPRWKTGKTFLDWLISVALVIEVGLITMQTWRGVPSHFNHTPGFDHVVYHAMGWLIVIVTLAIGVITVLGFRYLESRPAMTVAIHGGILLLFLGCILGMVTSVVGEMQIEAGRPPEIYGKAGVLKFPHGMPLHAIQMLPMLALFYRRIGWREATQVWTMVLANLGFVLLTVYALLQTFGGRSRVDVTLLSGSCLVVGLVVLIVPGFMALFSTTPRTNNS